MKRRESLKVLSAMGITTLGINSLVSAKVYENFLQEVQFTTEMVRGNVGLFKSRGGTIGWVSTPEGFSVVDTQFPDQAKALIGFLKEKSDKPVKLLFNSHHHGDHSAGNIAFKGLAEKIIAHSNSRSNMERVAKARDREATQLYPDTTFDKSWKGKLGSETVTSTHFGAAHTNGDSVVHFEESNVAHVGDLIFNRRHPYIDQSSGASISGWIDVLSSIRNNYERDTIYICGHSGNGHDIKINADDIKVAEEYFEKLLAATGKAMKAGKSKEEIVAMTSIPGVDWATEGSERSYTAAYNELSK